MNGGIFLTVKCPNNVHYNYLLFLKNNVNGLNIYSEFNVHYLYIINFISNV